MTRPVWKDYSLRMHRRSENRKSEYSWFVPEIDRKALKNLMRRSDKAALIDTTIWIGLLVLSAIAVVLLWGSWWAVPVLAFYGAIHQRCVAVQHELSHGTAFKTRWINEVVFHFASFLTITEGNYQRWRHTRHHTDTIIVGEDPEILSMRPTEVLKLFGRLFNIPGIFLQYRLLMRLASGRLGEACIFVPENEARPVINNARLYLLAHALVILASLWFNSWLPVILVILPLIYGRPMVTLLHFTQHAGLHEDVYDHRLSTRTMYLSRPLQWLYMNMNYHIEHHMFPMVPFHQLPALHEIVKAQCPKPANGILAAWCQIIPVLWRARYEPGYTQEVVLPENARAGTVARSA